MIVAALRLMFALAPSGGSSKKDAQKIKDRLWQKFKVSVAEIPQPGSLEFCIGVSLVGSNPVALENRCQEIIRDLQDWGAVELTYDDREIIHFSDLEIERDLLKYDP